MVKRLLGIGTVLIAALGLALGVVALLLEDHQVRGLVAAVPGLEGQAEAVAEARNDLAGGLSATVDEITFDISKTVRGLLGQRPARPRVLIELPRELRTPAAPDTVETAELPELSAEPPAAMPETENAMPPEGTGIAEPPVPDLPMAGGPTPETGAAALSRAYESPPPPPMTPEQTPPATATTETPTENAPAETPTENAPAETPMAEAPAEPPMPPEPPAPAAPTKDRPSQATMPEKEAPPASAAQKRAPPTETSTETETANRTPAAIPGQPGAAEHRLAVRYYEGKGVLQDYPKAADLFRRAAMQGHAAAQYNLGIMNYFGQGVAPDISEAAHWFKRAAEQDFADAQYNLGFLYYEGLGVEKDPAKAWLWFSRAAKHGHTEATKVRDQLKAELPPEVTRE